jgi:hypothetical protein
MRKKILIGISIFVAIIVYFNQQLVFGFIWNNRLYFILLLIIVAYLVFVKIMFKGLFPEKLKETLTEQ